MKKMALAFLVIALIGCDLNPANKVTSIPVGGTHDFAGINVKVNAVFWISLNSIYVPLQNAIAIEIEIQNNRSSSVNYSSMLTWGAILESTGFQISDMYWIGTNNVNYFSGFSILPGAKAIDTITFSEYTDSPTSFTFKGHAPINGCDDFEIVFQLADIGYRAPI